MTTNPNSIHAALEAFHHRVEGDARRVRTAKHRRTHRTLVAQRVMGAATIEQLRVLEARWNRRSRAASSPTVARACRLMAQSFYSAWCWRVAQIEDAGARWGIWSGPTAVRSYASGVRRSLQGFAFLNSVAWCQHCSGLHQDGREPGCPQSDTDFALQAGEMSDSRAELPSMTLWMSEVELGAVAA